MRRIVFTSLLAMGVMATAYAQEPAAPASPASPASPAPQSQAAAKPDDAKPVVVTGCIGGGPAAFTLTNAMAASSAKPGDSPIGTAGISSSYDLTAKAGVDLAPHVGHKVEITGTPAPMTPGTGGAASTDKPAAGAKPPAAKLTVSALKMVSASCP